jgi:HEPN domain-containing protein
MKVSTREWVAKAEEDFVVAAALSRPRKKPVWASVCFHAQQWAEKYLKARWNEASIQFPRTHDLEQLLNQVVALEPFWAAFRPALKRLSNAAVLPRYPGTVVTKTEARHAWQTCWTFRKEARLSLGLA